MRGARLGAHVAVALVTGLAGAGCAAGGPAAQSKPAVVFPSREELAQIPSRVPRAEVFGIDDVAVETWSFEAQASSDAAAYEDASPWGDVARDLVKGHPQNLAPSAPLKCAAQELARFHAKNGAMPTEGFRRFVAARCGAVSAGVTPIYWSLTTPAPPPDAQLAPKAEEGFAKHVGAKLGSAHYLLGVAAAREGQRTTAVALLARDEAKLEPGTLVADASRRVTLRGAVRGDYAEIHALVNRGEVSTAPCASDPQVKPPGSRSRASSPRATRSRGSTSSGASRGSCCSTSWPRRSSPRGTATPSRTRRGTRARRRPSRAARTSRARCSRA